MNSIKKNLVVLSTLLLTTPVYAACDADSQTIFSCIATNNKQIEVCDAGKTIRYSYGKPGKHPELALAVPRAQATTFQWPGIGRYIYYSVSIPNGHYRYSVYSALDKIASVEHSWEKAYEAGVNVEKDNTLLATVICRDDTVVDHIEGVDLKPSQQ